jgi:hypothetical protein
MNMQRILTAALVLVLTLLTQGSAFALPLAVGAIATYGPMKTSDVNKIWRKVQTNLQEGINFISDEWEDLEDLEQFEVDWSTREIIVPLDINEDAGVASIPEDGYEARPMSPNVEELSLTWILLNARFTITKTARWIDERSPRAMVKKQLTYQGMKKLQAIGKQFSQYFYGVSTGVLAKTDTDLTTSGDQTLTLYDAYGQTDIDDKEFLCSLFTVGDFVAVYNSSTLEAIGKVKSKNTATPSITLTWTGGKAPSGAVSTNGLTLFKANSLENDSDAGTDKDRALVGLLDGMKSTSVHGLSKSSVPDWDVAYADSTGGRFTGTRLRRAKDEIANEGGGKVDVIWMAQGVYRDMTAYHQAALRYNDPFSMEVEGDLKNKGVTWKRTKRIPPQYTFCGVKRSLRRMTLLPKPGERVPWSDMEKIPDRSGYVASMDFPCALVWLNRKNVAYFSGLDEA